MVRRLSLAPLKFLPQMLRDSATLLALLACGVHNPSAAGQQSEEQVDWGYWGPGAPNNWGSLSPDFVLCATGLQQSPIDISGVVEDPGAPPLKFDYGDDAMEINHNGMIAHVEYGEGNSFTVGDVSYRLAAMHIHVHAEHQINHELYPAEMHLVHRRDDGSLGVVGQLYKLGEADPVVQALIDAYPESGRSLHSGFSLNAAAFVPGDLGYYHYQGSLTTPPCSEGVNWFVLREIRTISQEQVNRIAELHNGFNHRPIQARNGRALLDTGPRPSGN